MPTAADPNIIENLSYDELLTRLRDNFIQLWPADAQDSWRDTLALESEPVVKVLETLAYLELLLRARINAAARANLLAFANDKDLDRLAEFYGLYRFAGEHDAEFRKRVIARIQGSSTAGPREHYHHHTLSAHKDVRDAHIASPRPGLVLIAVLPNAGADGDSVLAAVKARVLADDVRVLTDTVQIVLAKYKAATIHAGLQLNKTADPSIVTNCRAALTKHINALGLGDSLTLSAIMAALHQDGVLGVQLQEPAADIHCAEDTLITLDDLTLDIL